MVFWAPNSYSHHHEQVTPQSLSFFFYKIKIMATPAYKVIIMNAFASHLNLEQNKQTKQIQPPPFGLRLRAVI